MPKPQLPVTLHYQTCSGRETIQYRHQDLHEVQGLRLMADHDDGDDDGDDDDDDDDDDN